MGLAEPKRKKQLLPSNHAPSTWSKAAPASSIGFKLMSSMGWEPGVGLGSDLQGEKDNVKYSLKDDLLGVGAKKEYGGGVWRGMTEVDDLYKRLDVGNNSPKPENGVEEKVVTEVKEEVRLKAGWRMRFQVGDTYTSSFSREESEATSGVTTPAVDESQSEEKGEKKSKKRKRDGDGEKKSKKSKKEKPTEKDEEKPKESKEKKSKKKEAEQPVKEKKPKKQAKEGKSKSSAPVAAEPEKKRRKSQKDKVPATCGEATDLKPTANGTPIAADTKTEKKSNKDKKEKKDKIITKKEKEPKKSSKKDKTKDKSSKLTDSDTTAPIPVTTSVTTITETIVAPPETDRTSPVPRHMHRSRYLAMKRAATMDKNALREILGVKG